MKQMMRTKGKTAMPQNQSNCERFRHPSKIAILLTKNLNTRLPKKPWKLKKKMGNQTKANAKFDQIPDSVKKSFQFGSWGLQGKLKRVELTKATAEVPGLYKGRRGTDSANGRENESGESRERAWSNIDHINL
jgi:hypothetical protein